MNDKNADKNVFDNILDERYCNCLLCDCNCQCQKNDNFWLSNSCLTEIDFYPLYDNRVLKSYIEDIKGGDNFADYCEYIFELYEEEGYYD